MMRSFDQIIDEWPGGPSEFAAAIGVSASHARQMRRRDSIDSKYWKALVEAAAHHRLADVTLESLAAISASKRLSGAAA